MPSPGRDDPVEHDAGLVDVRAGNHAPQYEHVDADTEHPLTAPAPPFVGSEINKALSGHDVLLLAGVSIRAHLWTPEPPLPAGIRVVQLDDDPAEIGRAHDVEIGLYGAIGATLGTLAQALRSIAALRPAAAVRSALAAAVLGPERSRWRERARAGAGPAPVHPDRVGLARSMGLAAHRVEHAAQIGPSVRAAQRSGHPQLVEIPIRGFGDGAGAP